MADKTRWWDRDPVKIWAPLAALVAVVLQTVAYAGYQSFYGGFGVGADEVGFDYSATLRRTSAPLAMSFILTLLIVSVIGLLIPPVVSLVRASGESERSRTLRESYPGRARRQAGLVVLWFAALYVVIRMSHGRAAMIAATLTTVGLLTFDVWRSQLRQEPSTLSVFLEPRRQGGLRHLLTLATALALGATIRDWRWVPVLAVTMFWFDRTYSADTSAEAPSLHERLRRVPFWFVSVVAMLVLAGLAVALVAQVDWWIRLAHVDQKMRQVRSGAELSFQPFAPFGLIQPQARRVTVSWIGQNPPSPFLDGAGMPQSRLLTFFGQSAGIAVFYDTNAGNILRLPSGALYLEKHVDGHP